MDKSHSPFVKLILLALLTVTGYMTWSSLTTIMGGTGMALLMALAVLGACWVLAQAGTLVRVGAVLAGLGIVVWKDIMYSRQGD
jgi:hypothetical protein